MTEQLNMIPAAARQLQVTYLPHAHIYADPAQPRVDADAELTASIAQEGIRQPITVRRHPERLDSFMIVDGERRWRGALGIMDEVPAIVRDDQDDDVARLMGQLVSNTGKPLTPLEEARAYAQLLEQSGLNQSDLADRLGVPRTTFGDRVRLLELGPWVPLIESGLVPYSLAVEHLVPIRGVPDKFHEQVIEKMKKDWRWERNSKTGATGISTSDFGRLLDELARHLFYPLTKTKAAYHKQPEFPTSKHDAECSCGGMKVSIEGDGKRLCCGNPDWWRPLHRKATAAKKKAEGAKRPDAPRVPKWAQLPVEGSMRKEKYHFNARPNETVLVQGGRWALQRPEEGFDPKVLLEHLSADKIVLVEAGYGQGNEKYHVVTTDAAAVKVAQESYQARWAAKAETIAERRKEKIAKLKDDTDLKVTGAGARFLLARLLDRENIHVVHGLAQLLDLEPSKLKADQWGFVHGTAFEKWILALDAKGAAALATVVAMQISGKLGKTIADEVKEKQVSEFDTLRKLPIEWPGTPAPKGAKSRASEKPGNGTNDDTAPDSELDDEDEEDDEAVLDDEGLTDDMEDEEELEEEEVEA